MLRISVVYVAALVLGALPPLCAAADAQAPPQLQTFLAERPQMLQRLVEPPKVCVARHDTDHPVFHGCIDWHSSVHGTWALVAVGAALHDQKLLDRARGLLDPNGLEQERHYLEDHPGFEMPYGRSWFLRLAVDFERATGDHRLAQLGEDVARSLRQNLDSRPIDPRARDYHSNTWALINLSYYAKWKKDTALRSWIEGVVQHTYASVAGACPALQEDADATDFMPVCTNWAWLVSLYQPPGAFQPWVVRFLPPDSPAVAPITAPRSPHHHGIDFSRAWGLWAVYRSTHDARYLTLYLAHLHTGLDHHDWWDGDYDTLSHWVAQFGILAVAETFGDDPGQT
jgi:hypothetical protein